MKWREKQRMAIMGCLDSDWRFSYPVFFASSECLRKFENWIEWRWKWLCNPFVSKILSHWDHDIANHVDSVTSRQHFDEGWKLLLESQILLVSEYRKVIHIHGLQFDRWHREKLEFDRLEVNDRILRSFKTIIQRECHFIHWCVFVEYDHINQLDNLIHVANNASNVSRMKWFDSLYCCLSQGINFDDMIFQPIKCG
jgi:hypothetical protein